MATTAAGNRLRHETSPYLLQHAANPVDWHPWGEEALARARQEDKPILLSIGYSACHWCHVMAHESFEDEATAEVMNTHFINVKVDREERPDLDKVYQLAFNLLTGHAGGWPLTVFLAPDEQAPFFAGTYFPREARYGLPAFADLLKQVAEFYRDNRAAVRQQNHRMLQALQGLARPEAAASQPDDTPLATARQDWRERFDTRHGGFGDAPKFPQPSTLAYLLHHWSTSRITGNQDREAFQMVRTTLQHMIEGGVYDQLGGGFYRYSVDARWEIPHFEKMLYDNGPLLTLCADLAAQPDGDLFRRAATETAGWVIREMQSPEGGYYASLDADSEGEEGRYYVWTPDEVDQHLDAEAAALFKRGYGLDQAPNFEGRWHLRVAVRPEVLARDADKPLEEVAARLAQARERLFAVRETRVRPGRDDKILTAWNGLMIQGMARAGRRLNDPGIIESAERALTCLRENLWQDGRLLASYKDGRARFPAYLDDHVFLASGILELLQCRWRSEDLRFAQALMDVVLDHFRDPETGGFFFTADDSETLIQRPRPLMDESTPSGNGVAAANLLRLGHLLGESRYLDAAHDCLRAAWASIAPMPSAHATLLIALAEALAPPPLIVLRGEAEAMKTWQDWLEREPHPERWILPIPTAARDLPPRLAEFQPQGDAVAYVCQGTACAPPATSLETLGQVLRQNFVRQPDSGP